jgi:ribonuclease BN (tRNA processing enzyme)
VDLSSADGADTMRMTVLGGCGAWPEAGRACSGYLIEDDGFRLLVDPGYATLPRLLKHVGAADVDAVLVSHGHPDHCADLNPLLRARALDPDPPPKLPVHALPGALDRVLALDRPGMLDGALAMRPFTAGVRFEIGPFTVDTWALPHFVPNAGLRLTSGGHALAYTGDAGPCREIVDLARDADLFLAEATYPDEVPPEDARYLSSARQAGEHATAAGAARLMLTHLWPGTLPSQSTRAAQETYDGDVEVAREGETVSLG